MGMITIRQATMADYPAIYQLVETAFKTARVSDGTEQDFVENLRKSDNYLPELELVAEVEGVLVGHVMLTKQIIHTASGQRAALLLAPLCVAFDYRNQGIGGQLMTAVFERAVALSHDAVFLVGDPNYYKQYGFRHASELGITNDSEIPDEFILGMELVPDALKEVTGSLKID